MGLFDIFDKKECNFCGNKVGVIGRKKLKDGTYICKECEKQVSEFFVVGKYTKEQTEKHIEYMKLMDKVYKEAFEPLPKDEKQRIINLGYFGIVLANSIGMFEVIDQYTAKKTYKELYRYDQIRDYEIYTKENSSNDKNSKKYSEVGVTIHLDCAEAIGNAHVSDTQKELMHPYASEINILCARDTDNTHDALYIVNRLDEIFGKASSNLVGSIKEKFTGTGHERAGRKAVGSTLGALGSLAKSTMSGDVNDAAAAQEKLKAAAGDITNYATEGRLEYQKAADQVETRVLGTTLREALKSL